MRFTVILTQGPVGWAVSVPAMPGCFAQEENREAAIARARQAMILWLEGETAAGRGPLEDSPRVIADGVADAIESLREPRESSDPRAEAGDQLELLSLDLPLPVPV